MKKNSPFLSSGEAFLYSFVGLSSTLSFVLALVFGFYGIAVSLARLSVWETALHDGYNAVCCFKEGNTTSSSIPPAEIAIDAQLSELSTYNNVSCGRNDSIHSYHCSTGLAPRSCPLWTAASRETSLGHVLLGIFLTVVCLSLAYGSLCLCLCFEVYYESLSLCGCYYIDSLLEGRLYRYCCPMRQIHLMGVMVDLCFERFCPKQQEEFGCCVTVSCSLISFLVGILFGIAWIPPLAMTGQAWSTTLKGVGYSSPSDWVFDANRFVEEFQSSCGRTFVNEYLSTEDLLHSVAYGTGFDFVVVLFVLLVLSALVPMLCYCLSIGCSWIVHSLQGFNCRAGKENLFALQNCSALALDDLSDPEAIFHPPSTRCWCDECHDSPSLNSKKDKNSRDVRLPRTYTRFGIRLSGMDLLRGALDWPVAFVGTSAEIAHEVIHGGCKLLHSGDTSSAGLMIPSSGSRREGLEDDVIVFSSDLRSAIRRAPPFLTQHETGRFRLIFEVRIAVDDQTDDEGSSCMVYYRLTEDGASIEEFSMDATKWRHSEGDCFTDRRNAVVVSGLLIGRNEYEDWGDVEEAEEERSAQELRTGEGRVPAVNRSLNHDEQAVEVVPLLERGLPFQ